MMRPPDGRAPVRDDQRERATSDGQTGISIVIPAYLGARTIVEFQKRAKFVRISPAGVRESHAHGVLITRESPNYPGTVA